METHYFQRYHSKENVATANTMLLLSRLYNYSPGKFYDLLKAFILRENADAELTISMQETGPKSVPDAVIAQPSFKVVVETKLGSQFDLDQLVKHLELFQNQDCMVLLTLDPKQMDHLFQKDLNASLLRHNTSKLKNIIHKHLTFQELLNAIRESVDERDYDMIEIINDYENYCYESSLITDAWKRLRVRLTSQTFDFNVAHNLYYDDLKVRSADHDYLGLYKDKSVRAIGKIADIIEARIVDNKIHYTTIRGSLTEEKKHEITTAIETGKRDHN